MCVLLCLYVCWYVFLLCVQQNCDRVNDTVLQQHQLRNLSRSQCVADPVHRHHHVSEDGNVFGRNHDSLRHQEFADRSTDVTCPPAETSSDADVALKQEQSEDNNDSSQSARRCRSQSSKRGTRRGKRRRKSEAAAKANSDQSEGTMPLTIQTSSHKQKPLRLKVRKSKRVRDVEKSEPDEAECSESDKQLSASDDTVYTCDECGKEFPNSNKLAKHKRTHSSRAFHCNECSTDFAEAVAFKRHSVLVHGIHRPFTCSHAGCNYRSDRLSNVEKHMSIHSPTHAFACSLCGRTFAQDAGLRSHLLSCMSSRSFLCDLCGSSFNHLQSMQSHQRIHTGERPYRCTDCDSTFADHRNYKRHRRIHDNAFPYECMLCGKHFRHSNSLKSHLGSHGILTKPVSLEGTVAAPTNSSRVDFPGIFSKPVESASVTPTHSSHTLAHTAF